MQQWFEASLDSTDLRVMDDQFKLVPQKSSEALAEYAREKLASACRYLMKEDLLLRRAAPNGISVRKDAGKWMLSYPVVIKNKKMLVHPIFAALAPRTWIASTIYECAVEHSNVPVKLGRVNIPVKLEALASVLPENRLTAELAAIRWSRNGLSKALNPKDYYGFTSFCATRIACQRNFLPKLMNDKFVKELQGNSWTQLGMPKELSQLLEQHGFEGPVLSPLQEYFVDHVNQWSRREYIIKANKMPKTQWAYECIATVPYVLPLLTN